MFYQLSFYIHKHLYLVLILIMISKTHNQYNQIKQQRNKTSQITEINNHISFLISFSIFIYVRIPKTKCGFKIGKTQSESIQKYVSMNANNKKKNYIKYIIITHAMIYITIYPHNNDNNPKKKPTHTSQKMCNFIYITHANLHIYTLVYNYHIYIM